jgi:3-hydroxyisobutyrate dehydrogenase-like beta-hydroxyacid dehydrogenase
MADQDNGKERVGVIGVGRMGLAMAKHLINHGYPVSACDIDQASLDKARDMGAAIFATPAELGRNVDYVIVGVGYDSEVNEVVLGENGVLGTLVPGSLIAVSSTVAPNTIKRIGETAEANGVDVLDAPICRGRWYADAGELLALLGGKTEVVERSRPIFSTFCSDIAHLGDIGQGQVGKALNNLLLWINSIALIEAGRIAEATGMDLPSLRDALMISSAKSQALQDWDQISFTWALKDMQIVGQIADEAGLALPVTGAIKELVKEARRIKASNPPQWTRHTSGAKP